ncbi:MAG: hypothetical protein JWR80_8591 [Bradyrhizobium sp.]|nr:hypothetical protein [Bradyrhizobium sp.]
MPDRISVQNLQAAVDQAITKIKVKPGPIIIGFVAPAGFPEADAHKIAQEVAKISGLAGTPTVGVLGTSVASEALAESQHHLPPGHIIIGLVANAK